MPTRHQDRKSKPASEDRCGVFVVDAKRVERGQSALLADEVNADIAGTFKVLAHPTRVRIIQALAVGELCVCELTHALDEIQPKISRHLALLREAEVVLDRRQGQWIYYRLNPELPAWAQSVLRETAVGLGDQRLFTRDRKKLACMPNRPGSICC